MFFNHKNEDKQQVTEQQIETLSHQIDRLDRELELFHEDLDVSPDQLISFVECKDNFSEESWNILQSHKQQLDEKLSLDLNSIQNPLQAKKNYAERHVVQPHWLFVR